LSCVHRRSTERWPDLRNPRTFNEKVICKILYDRRTYLTLFADKLGIRAYVRLRARG
jgi:hypothetical protein